MSASNGERLREALDEAGALDVSIHFHGRREDYPAAQARCLERAATEYDRATAERIVEIDERLMRTEQMLLSKTADAFLAEQERDALRGRLPRCQVVEGCTNVAACFVFNAEGNDEYAFSCDEHCGHGNEDMHCESLANFAATLIAERNNAAIELEAVEKERDEARDWVRRLTQETRVLTCAFCGEAYPPNTPENNHEMLTAHVNVCAKHPMRGVERTVLFDLLERLGDHCHVNAPDDYAHLDADGVRLRIFKFISELEEHKTGGLRERIATLEAALTHALNDLDSAIDVIKAEGIEEDEIDESRAWVVAARMELLDGAAETVPSA